MWLLSSVTYTSHTGHPMCGSDLLIYTFKMTQVGHPCVFLVSSDLHIQADRQVGHSVCTSKLTW